MRKQATATTTPTPTTPENPDEYNGWTNYETWCVHLWISNDQGTAEYARELVAEAYARAQEETRANPKAITAPRADAADALREWFADEDPLADHPGVFSDLLTHALSRVDWYAVADAFRDEE